MQAIFHLKPNPHVKLNPELPRKAAFNNKKTLVTNQLDLPLWKTAENCYMWSEHSFVCCWNLDAAKSGPEIPGNF
jgi:hypothetical protein